MLLRWLAGALLTVVGVLAGALPAARARWDPFAAAEAIAQHSNRTIERHLQVFLVVGVVSAPRNFAWRHAIRKSWFRLCPDEIATIQACLLRFVIGSVAERDLEAKLQHEVSLHGDIVRVPVADGYDSLIYKVLHFFDFCELYSGLTYKYLMRVNDDTFVNLRSIVADLTLGKMGSSSSTTVSNINSSSNNTSNSSSNRIPHTSPFLYHGHTFLLSI